LIINVRSPFTVSLDYKKITRLNNDLTIEERVTPGDKVELTATIATGRTPDAIYNYTWIDGKADTLAKAMLSPDYSTNRLYKDSKFKVYVVDNHGCKADTITVVPVDWPTAITPYTPDGLNDVFVPEIGCHMIIFNRYGQKVYEGKDGWDGTYGGKLADPGAYFYVVDLPDGEVKKGTVEIVKIK